MSVKNVVLQNVRPVPVGVGAPGDSVISPRTVMASTTVTGAILGAVVGALGEGARIEEDDPHGSEIFVGAVLGAVLGAVGGVAVAIPAFFLASKQ